MGNIADCSQVINSWQNYIVFRKKIAAAAAHGSLSVSAYSHKAGVRRAEENETCDVDRSKEKSGGTGTFAASR